MSEELSPKVQDFTAHLAAIDAIAAPKPLPKVFIALCSRDWQVEHLTSEFVRVVGNKCKCQIQPLYMANDGVARSRNNLAAAFLESDGTHLLFLDNDIFGLPEFVDRLIEADKDIVCGLYPKKQASLDFVMNGLPDERINEKGLLKVKHAGTGFMMVRRRVLEEMIAKLPEIAYGGDPSPETRRWDFFPMHAVEGRYDSEDWFFCNRARALGFDVWVDTHIQLRHVGKIVYPLQFSLTDEECVDILHHRYDIPRDHIRTFIASGRKPPHFMGGHMPRKVRHWPESFPVDHLHQGAELAGCYDVPVFEKEVRPPVVLDIGADVGAFAIWACKRWPGAHIHSYEERPNLFQCLENTQERLRTHHVKQAPILKAYGEKFGIPEGTTPSIIKVDVPGHERDILTALYGSGFNGGLLGSADFILVKYSDDTLPMALGMWVGATHVLHVHQRFGEGVGIVKYINRRLFA